MEQTKERKPLVKDTSDVEYKLFSTKYLRKENFFIKYHPFIQIMVNDIVYDTDLQYFSVKFSFTLLEKSNEKHPYILK